MSLLVSVVQDVELACLSVELIHCILPSVLNLPVIVFVHLLPQLLDALALLDSHYALLG